MAIFYVITARYFYIEKIMPLIRPLERDAIQEMYEMCKISYGTSVSMKNDITLLELQME